MHSNACDLRCNACQWSFTAQSLHVHACPCVNLNVPACPCMSLHACACPWAPLRVVACPFMPLHALACLCLSFRAFECLCLRALCVVDCAFVGEPVLSLWYCVDTIIHPMFEHLSIWRTFQCFKEERPRNLFFTVTDWSIVTQTQPKLVFGILRST